MLARQSLKIDTQHLAGMGEIHPFVDEALGIHTLADPRIAEDLGALVLDDAGPYPFQHVVPGAKLEDDAIDPANVEEMGEERAGRPAPDDDYPGACGDLAHLRDGSLLRTRSGRHWGRPDDPGRRDLLSPVTPGGSLAMTFVPE